MSHPAGSKLHYCRCCPATRRQPLMPGGVGKAVLACPSCDPGLFCPLAPKKAKP